MTSKKGKSTNFRNSQVCYQECTALNKTSACDADPGNQAIFYGGHKD